MTIEFVRPIQEFAKGLRATVIGMPSKDYIQIRVNRDGINNYDCDGSSVSQSKYKGLSVGVLG